MQVADFKNTCLAHEAKLVRNSYFRPMVTVLWQRAQFHFWLSKQHANK